MEQFPLVIDGREVPAGDGRVFASVDPYARAPWAEAALAGEPEVTAAVESAREAFERGPWPRMSHAGRAAVLRRLGELVSEHREELARADVRDVGKPVTRLRGREIISAAATFAIWADLVEQASTDHIPREDGLDLRTRYEPAGVVAAITPWNVPLPMAAGRIAPALAWGNTVVLKPAEESPGSATLLARLALKAGLPPGALNVVHGFGQGSAGQLLVESEGVDRVAFTGSTGAGRAVAAAAGARLVPVSLECGGKSATLVFADADFERSLPLAASAAFGNSGQVCFAGSRILVEASRYEEAVAGLVELADAFVLGDPSDERTELGPLVSQAQFERVCAYLDEIPSDGGTVQTGGALGEGWFVRPTVVTGLAPQARACREEIFGPVVVVTPFTSEDEAVALANGTDYGLSATVLTTDRARADRLVGALQAGTVWVNTWGVVDKRAPFGGVKQSGIGRQGGSHGRDFHTEPKAVFQAG